MEWEQIDSEEYEKLFGESATVFHSASFNLMNASRAYELAFLAVRSNPCHYGLIIGKKRESWHSPFSSPFGGIEFIGKTNYSQKKEVVSRLADFLNRHQMHLQITAPPEAYQTFVPCFFTEDYDGIGFTKKYADTNFHIDLTHSDYQKQLERNARKNLNQALQSDPELIRCETAELKRKAYGIIQQNRAEKGYPLKMSFDQILETSEVVNMDFFLLRIKNDYAASALVYSVTRAIAMVVYWGHPEEYSKLRPINALSYLLVQEYKLREYSILDIGPSSEFGILNDGLARFKRSIGCAETPKTTLIYEYDR
jgi:hypothetical protein